MALGPLIARLSSRTGGRLTTGRLRTAAVVLAIYAAARIVTTAFLLIAASLSGPTSRFGADATIADLSMGWDGQWYWLIAVEGYPDTLPVTEAGTVAENAWAFMPVYPFLAKVVGALLGGYPAGAIAVSLLAGGAACLALSALLVPRIGRTASLWAVALFAGGPLGALFHMGYAEALFALWLLLALLALVRRRFGWLYPLVVLMGYTRPGVLAFALLLGLYGILRWMRRRRDPLPTAHVAHILALGALAVVVGFSWQVLAGIVTGDASAYLDTELAWRRGWVGADHEFVPFSGWVLAPGIWFGVWGIPAVVGYTGLVLLLGAVVVALVRSRSVRLLGPEIRLWAASYGLYLLAVFFPQSSVFRLMMPFTPLVGALAAPRSLLWRLGVLGAGLLGQWWWIHEMLALGNTFARIP